MSLPIPHAYFKSVLTENVRGHLHMWSFVIPNKATAAEVESFRVATTQVERYAGIKLWERLQGVKIEREKTRIRRMW